MEGYKNRPTRELKIYQKAPGVNPAETQSTAWVSPLALDFFLETDWTWLNPRVNVNSRKKLLKGERGTVEAREKEESALDNGIICLSLPRGPPGGSLLLLNSSHLLHKLPQCQNIRGIT